MSTFSDTLAEVEMSQSNPMNNDDKNNNDNDNNGDKKINSPTTTTSKSTWNLLNQKTASLIPKTPPQARPASSLGAMSSTISKIQTMSDKMKKKTTEEQLAVNIKKYFHVDFQYYSTQGTLLL